MAEEKINQLHMTNIDGKWVEPKIQICFFFAFVTHNNQLAAQWVWDRMNCINENKLWKKCKKNKKSNQRFKIKTDTNRAKNEKMRYKKMKATEK